VDGSIGSSRLTLRDQSGGQLAEVKKHPMSTRHDIIIDGQRVAEVRHEGLFGARYHIDSSVGNLSAKGNFTGWEYSISDGGRLIATVSRQLALKETFVVDSRQTRMKSSSSRWYSRSTPYRTSAASASLGQD
jgi:uncharacterized protein YxjI